MTTLCTLLIDSYCVEIRTLIGAFKKDSACRLAIIPCQTRQIRLIRIPELYQDLTSICPRSETLAQSSVALESMLVQH